MLRTKITYPMRRTKIKIVGRLFSSDSAAVRRSGTRNLVLASKRILEMIQQRRTKKIAYKRGENTLN